MGRRPAGSPNTRDAIVRSATRLIARRGVRAVSVRAVAKDAGVDPALIYRYFPNKEGLFIEALRTSFRLIPPRETPEGLEFEGIGEKIVYRFLTTWGVPASAPLVVSLLRAAAEDERTERQLREYIEGTIVPATREHHGDAATHRAPMVGSVLLGVGVMRYLLHIEPLASMTDEEVARFAGPVVTSILAGKHDPRR